MTFFGFLGVIAKEHTGLFICSETWVGLTFLWSVHYLPGSAWADRSLAELAGQLVKMMENANKSQHNPGVRPPVSSWPEEKIVPITVTV